MLDSPSLCFWYTSFISGLFWCIRGNTVACKTFDTRGDGRRIKKSQIPSNSNLDWIPGTDTCKNVFCVTVQADSHSSHLIATGTHEKKS